MKIPQHVAIILDGNGRWAKAKGMPRNYGHVQGAKNVENICRLCHAKGIKYLTIYAFSTENWKRPKDEVKTLMKLLGSYLESCISTSKQDNMRVRLLGDRAGLDTLINKIERLEAVSKDNTGLNLQIAVNYGSRDEILRGVKKLVGQAEQGLLKAEELTQEKIAQANKDYLERVAKEKELDEEYSKNIEETNKCLDALIADGTMQESDADDVVAFLFKIVHDGIVGKFAPDTLLMALKAIKHDADVADAEAYGETRGRNAKIEERLRKGKKGDGMAQLDGGGAKGGSGEARNLGALGNYGDANKSIWERGGERRISR